MESDDAAGAPPWLASHRRGPIDDFCEDRGRAFPINQGEFGTVTRPRAMLPKHRVWRHCALTKFAGAHYE
jgi:hypothetical protein